MFAPLLFDNFFGATLGVNSYSFFILDYIAAIFFAATLHLISKFTFSVVVVGRARGSEKIN